MDITKEDIKKKSLKRPTSIHTLESLIRSDFIAETSEPASILHILKPGSLSTFSSERRQQQKLID